MLAYASEPRVGKGIRSDPEVLPECRHAVLYDADRLQDYGQKTENRRVGDGLDTDSSLLMLCW